MNAALNRSLRNIKRYTDKAAKVSAELGHRLGGWEVEEDWHAAVTTCKRCHLIAAVDLTESPYLFGRALKRKCK